jgi:pilus assembly protein Flp/PilA
MSKMFSLLGRFYRDESGATMIEYSLMVALIALVLIAVVGTVGLSVSGIFSNQVLQNALANS